MSVIANRNLAHELGRAWSIEVGGDIEPLMRLLAEDLTVEAMVKPELLPAFAAPWNKQEFRAWVLKETAVTAIRLEVTGVCADEDRVAIEAVTRMKIGTHSYNNVYHMLAEVRNGLIFKLRVYQDTLHLKQAMEWIEQQHHNSAARTER